MGHFCPYNFEEYDFVPLFITLNTCFENQNGIRAGYSHSYSQNFWKLNRFHVPSDSIYHQVNPPYDSKNQNFEKMEKTPGDIIILRMSTKIKIR